MFFLCYYEGDKDGGQCVTRKGSINEVFWNDQFIIAYADGGGKKEKIYYIIEQLETDTFIDVGDGKKIPLNTQYGEPWITEEYEFYNDFNKRLQDLSLDTTKMHRYAWKYWVGIY